MRNCEELAFKVFARCFTRPPDNLDTPLRPLVTRSNPIRPLRGNGITDYSTNRFAPVVSATTKRRVQNGERGQKDPTEKYAVRSESRASNQRTSGRREGNAEWRIKS